MYEVVIYGLGSFGVGGDGNVVFGGEFEEIGMVLEFFDEFGYFLGGDDFYFGVVSFEGKFEVDLVILDFGISIMLFGIFE